MENVPIRKLTSRKNQQDGRSEVRERTRGCLAARTKPGLSPAGRRQPSDVAQAFQAPTAAARGPAFARLEVRAKSSRSGCRKPQGTSWRTKVMIVAGCGAAVRANTDRQDGPVDGGALGGVDYGGRRDGGAETLMRWHNVFERAHFEAGRGRSIHGGPRASGTMAIQLALKPSSP